MFGISIICDRFRRTGMRPRDSRVCSRHSPSVVRSLSSVKLCLMEKRPKAQISPQTERVKTSPAVGDGILHRRIVKAVGRGIFRDSTQPYFLKENHRKLQPSKLLHGPGFERIPSEYTCRPLALHSVERVTLPQSSPKTSWLRYTKHGEDSVYMLNGVEFKAAVLVS